MSSNYGSYGQLLVVWIVRSHKAHGGITVGVVVGVAIVCQELVVPLVFLDLPPIKTHLLDLLGIVWVCVDTREDIG